MRVGFLGLGNMGRPMARHLVNGGHEVRVWNRTAARTNDVVAAGAVAVATPADAARQAAVVVTMVADDGSLEAVCHGDDGLLTAMAPGAVHVSISTVSVALADRLAEAHAAAGQQFVSAPVFGRPDAAAAAKLFIVAAGDGAAIATCQPLFDLVGQRTFVVGDSPSLANVAKLAGNFMIASTAELLGEALALVRKHGVEAGEFVDLLTSTLFGAPIVRNYGAIIAGERYQPAGFPLRLGLKDIELVLAAAKARHVPMPVASVVRDQMLTGLATGLADHDWAAVAKVAARNAGL